MAALGLLWASVQRLAYAHTRDYQRHAFIDNIVAHAVIFADRRHGHVVVHRDAAQRPASSTVIVIVWQSDSAVAAVVDVGCGEGWV